MGKVITSEYTYTLDEARKIINIERSVKREMLMQKISQKLLGVVAITISITEIVLGCTNRIDEGGLSIIMIPLGIYLLLTKKNIIGGYYE